MQEVKNSVTISDAFLLLLEAALMFLPDFGESLGALESQVAES